MSKTDEMRAIYVSVGDRIRQAREAMGITIIQIADALDVDPRTGQAGKVVPSVRRLSQIAALTEKPISFFIEEAAA